MIFFLSAKYLLPKLANNVNNFVAWQMLKNKYIDKMNERRQMQNIDMTKGSMSTYHEIPCKFGVRCYNYILILSKSDSLTKKWY